MLYTAHVRHIEVLNIKLKITNFRSSTLCVREVVLVCVCVLSFNGRLVEPRAEFCEMEFGALDAMAARVCDVCVMVASGLTTPWCLHNMRRRRQADVFVCRSCYTCSVYIWAMWAITRTRCRVHYRVLCHASSVHHLHPTPRRCFATSIYSLRIYSWCYYCYYCY